MYSKDYYLHKEGDDNLSSDVQVDPRLSEDRVNIDAQLAQRKRTGRNTASFDPMSTLTRPSLRVLTAPPHARVYPVETRGRLKHDDVVIVPELFGAENDWSIYHKLIEEMTSLQQCADEPPGRKSSAWISWHEGSHLITKNPHKSKTFNMIRNRIMEYFNMESDPSASRFNWYRDTKDWKPFHHDSAAFNKDRAESQNITVGVSFGCTRELAFMHAKDSKQRVYFPQVNNMAFSFGRDANINWKHGINAMSVDEIHEMAQRLGDENKGRISIIIWGKVSDSMIKEEQNSPPLLEDNTTGTGHSMHVKSRRRQRPGHQRVQHFKSQ